jgi:hypothetical protein
MASQSSALPEIDESELDIPFIITQDQLMAFPPELRTAIQDLVAARQDRALTSPYIIPVTASQQFEEPELPILRSKDRNVAAIICTDSQEDQEVPTNISEESAPIKAPDTANRTGSSYIAPLPIYRAPCIETKDPEGTIVCTHPRKSYIQLPQPAPACQSQSEIQAAISIGLAQSGPFASSPRLSPAFALCDYAFVSNPRSPLQSISTCIVIRDPAPKLAVIGSPQHTTYSKSLAYSPSKSLRPSGFSYRAGSAFLSTHNLYIPSPDKPDQFPHLAFKHIPKPSIPVAVIVYPPRKSLWPPHFNSFNDSITALAITMFLDLFLAVQLIAATWAASHIMPARISRTLQSLSSAKMIIYSVLSMRGTTTHFAPSLASQSMPMAVASVKLPLRTPIRILDCNIVLSWLSSLIFALRCIFASRASPQALSKDRHYLPIRAAHFPASSDAIVASNGPSDLVPFMTGDSQY